MCKEKCGENLTKSEQQDAGSVRCEALLDGPTPYEHKIMNGFVEEAAFAVDQLFTPKCGGFICDKLLWETLRDLWRTAYERGREKEIGREAMMHYYHAPDCPVYTKAV